jgi:hypothetical protein
MDVEAGASARARRAVRQRRIGIGGVDDMREVANQRLQCLAQLQEALRQVARQRCARVVQRCQHAGAPEQRALCRRVDDDVGNEPGKMDIVGADRQQHEVELAVGLAAPGGDHRLAQFGKLPVD